MRYFFLAYAIVAVLVVGILGFRGQHFSKPPIQVFPDMDNQDKLKAQAPSSFFADRQGARQPVTGTQPLGFNESGKKELGGIPEYEFGGQTGYYYAIYCGVCHGESGNGAGITSRYGVPGIANLHEDRFKSPAYPDGRMFEVISVGKGMMSGYKANIPVRDRWAIISYVRTLQAAKEAATAAK